ncbi:hypothetical protein OKA05_27870 [Luteolibacter arcticus]|uniref:Uncharacterized protein n=1 Tax=Luteolibacter arcticus TaxID=1581411 RepID=A0ABT3GSA8_9BACT|nr:hypothetical protein [Luteolibacter arcticus]MCW1926401.1 hypothetical protein [Luteolibacter arcticus]
MAMDNGQGSNSPMKEDREGGRGEGLDERKNKNGDVDVDGDENEVGSLARRRWFGVGVCVVMMAVGALTFSLGFPQAGPALSGRVVVEIFRGPFCEPSYFPWFGRVDRSWAPWLAVVLLMSHPVFPRPVTVVTTCLGGGLWWLMGWYAIAAGA